MPPESGSSSLEPKHSRGVKDGDSSQNSKVYQTPQHWHQVSV